MPIRKAVIFALLFFGMNPFTYSQKSFEQKLELLFAQGHYKMVYRKAGRLLMNPAYDQADFPKKYRQMAAKELARNPFWAKRHAEELKVLGQATAPQNSYTTNQSIQIQQLLQEARKQLGVPYKTAGKDPSGFDCSGFTCYVFEQAGVQLPRRAADQYTFCEPIEAADATAGDLIFFSNGGQVNHVGILISERGAPKEMIHSSSSLGISIVEIETSNYWKPRVVGYGRIKRTK
jgi:cell wall-associated NlpC family hydrolase